MEQEIRRVTVRGLTLDPVTNAPIVILRTEDGGRYLPIWIGLFEANAIAMQIEGVTAPRPMTHDLLRDLAQTLGAEVTQAVVDNLLKPLGDRDNELVVFDTNRLAAKTALLISEPGPFANRMMADGTLPFGVTLVTNERPESRQVVARSKPPQSTTVTQTQSLKRAWPAGVFSLSHVALPFPPDDPLYGQRPPDDAGRLFLGRMAIQGERGE